MPLSQTTRDRIWLVWFCLQIPVILCVDAVDTYPAWLCADPGAPLHFLHTFRQWYVTTYNDPLMDWTPASGAAVGAGGPWMTLFLWIEIAATLPIVLYSVYRFTRLATATSTATAPSHAAASTTGPWELLFLVYAFETALTTAVCIHDVGYWSPAVYSEADKNVFRYQLFGPYFAMPALLFVDMYSRLLARFNVDSTKKTQ
ncbi:hypothetical protein SPBR_00984 [Sporothrix brasiliensis 5110]|uniref:EXPERA domain-containing protein n=1 Tax=Sporothrix brasiliensis 5110 TaxID=1398154 RepID=A0A0C2IY47_9PEZI|nr:uncharacterized protein SPBR_00984 [Sporothrix brasiliensis 5110]KIH89952.1 hypothetical protein SPBR_00984 [Sporothrix brasiliensis 5110]